MAVYQPVEEHAGRGQMLFQGLLGMGVTQFLDIRGDMDRFETREVAQGFALEPAAKRDAARK